MDVVLIDTAGRMQDNEPLMRALAKVGNLLLMNICVLTNAGLKSGRLIHIFVGKNITNAEFIILFIFVLIYILVDHNQST